MVEKPNREINYTETRLKTIGSGYESYLLHFYVRQKFRKKRIPFHGLWKISKPGRLAASKQSANRRNSIFILSSNLAFAFYLPIHIRFITMSDDGNNSPNVESRKSRLEILRERQKKLRESYKSQIQISRKNLTIDSPTDIAGIFAD